MTRRALLLVAVVGFLLVAGAPTKGAPVPPVKEVEDKEALSLPEGVIHVSLPPGTIEWERIFKNEKPLLRVSVGKTVIVARHVFIGDGKAATEYEATKDGILWPSVKSRRGPTVGSMSWEGGTINLLDGDFLTVDKLKPGSVYLTTPTMKFEFRPADKDKSNSPRREDKR